MRFLLCLAILFCASLVRAETKGSSYAVLYTTNTWFAAQLGLGQYPNWVVDGSFVGPNQPGVYTIKFKSLTINGDLVILNAYGTIDE